MQFKIERLHSTIVGNMFLVIKYCFNFFNGAHCDFPVLEVYQFARDAAVAEAWLIAQEPYLMSTELGVSIIRFSLKINNNNK